MTVAIFLNHFSTLRFKYFSWRREASLAQKIILALFMAALTGLCAQVVIPLPFTPVPVTGQTFAVLLSAVMLGRHWGGLSQTFYVVIGACGMPWFSASAGGLGVVFGPTGGYLLGFVLMAFVLGHVLDRDPALRSFWALFPFMLAGNFVLIFLPGLLGLAFWYYLVEGNWPALEQILSLGFYPFVPGAIVKTFLAAGVARAILPQRNSVF